MITVALLLTASVALVQSPAAGLTLPLESYPAEIRKDIAPLYDNARSHPADANAVGSLGRMLQAWEQWQTAHDVYSRAIALAPKAFEWPYLDAFVLDRLARPQDAAARLGQALKIRPDYLPAKVRLGDALLSAGQLSESRAIFRSCRTILGPNRSHCSGWAESSQRKGSTRRPCP